VGSAEPAKNPGGAAPASASPVGDLVESYLQSTLLNPANAPQHSYVEVARMLQQMRPELVLSRFPPARREQLRALPPAQMAAEIIEDSAVNWAAKHLSTAPTGPEAFIVEEEVIRVLVRTLQTTQTAERLAIKLAQYVTDLSLPKAAVSRIQEELAWVTVAESRKVETLLQLHHFGRHEFRRLVELVRELIKGGDKETATRVALHYLEVVRSRPGANPEEISRLPELFSQMANVRGQFWSAAADLLVEALPRTGRGAGPMLATQALSGQDYRHWQVLNCMVALAKDVAPYEEFALIERVGEAMEKLATEDAANHEACCRITLSTLLTPSAIERLIEISVQKGDDVVWGRTAAPLLRWSGAAAIGKLFQQLESEQAESSRNVLIRLIARLGPAALDLARQQLADPHWYVVRNACRLLVELKDPDLAQQLAPVLRHPDERAQKAAAKAIRESRHPAHGVIFAEALPFLHPAVAEKVLDELLYLRDPATVPALERFILHEARGKTGPLMMAVQALAVIPGEHVEQLLGTILADSTLEGVVRRVAMIALARSSTSASADFLREWLQAAPQDPMAQEIRNTLKAFGRTL
jgi:HEAT repeat protein